MTPAAYLDNNVGLDRLTVEEMFDSLKVFLNVRAQCRCHFNVSSCELKFHITVFRSLEPGIFIWSLYFATVRLESLTPSRLRIFAI